VGQTLRSRLLGRLIAHLVSMIICHLNVVHIAAVKPKAPPPLIVDGNRILASPVSFQFMEPIAWRDRKVSHVRSEITILQLTQRPLPDSRREPLRPAALVQLLRTLVGKGLDHARSVMWRVTPVNADKIRSYRQDSAMFGWFSALDSLNRSHHTAQLALKNKPFTS